MCEERLDALEERIEALEQENAELRATNAELQDTIEGLVEIKGNRADVASVWIAGHPIGKMAERGKTANELLDELLADTYELNRDVVRSDLLPIHRDWEDVDAAAADGMEPNRRRGARLFNRFLRKLAGDRLTGVEESHGKLKLTSTRAREQLQDAGDIPPSNPSTTVKRAMQWVQRRSQFEDQSCGCGSLEDCTHGLFTWTPSEGRGYTLAVDKAAFQRYLRRVYGDEPDDRVGSSENGSADDAGEQPAPGMTAAAEAERTDVLEAEASEEMDRLVDAEITNSGVSYENGSVLVGDSTPHGGT